MRQAFHIFKKDVRRLRLEIGGILFLVLAFMAVELRTSPESNSGTAELLQLLLYAAWWILIARVIHGEAIPGDHHFWLTRPYDRRSLWCAKALFALAFIHLPLLGAQGVILAINGLPVTSTLGGLLWEQVLVATVIVLPAAVLAAVTASMVQFALAAILWVFAVVNVASNSQTPGYPGLLAWVPSSAAICEIGLLGFTILFLQFLRRRTKLSRLLAGAGTALGLVTYLLITWDSAFAVQSLLAPFRGRVVISLDNPRPTPPTAWMSKSLARVDVPLRVSGVDLDRMTVDLARVTLATSSGVLKVAAARMDRFPAGFSALLTLDQSVLQAVKDQTIRLHGTVFLTELGEEHSTELLVGGPPVNVPGVGRCFSAPFLGVEGIQVVCRAAFRWPSRLVQVRDESGSTHTLAAIDSYSPFPAILTVRPFSTKFMTLRPTDTRIAVVTRNPVSHVRYDFEIPEVRLADYLPARR